ncbi:TetR/AcrR family transcriptional regulator [Streptomyces telluris]|uniref:TetR/AcrR family transcriptional regulator n=1 Tax=Streptomyces telluris TaxID=2720021 RepID=A0A9X2RPU1_9ACTN|nr:TetR/AcrR family transcriptional regulator [Streptomyces telluris]MCQ8773489.1 TetR/AcrR family transcriptional regulator [Streptomyces telluris]NJP77053.1 TetR/AcrR family transcriptional regulator [Streptomyces telluris]
MTDAPTPPPSSSPAPKAPDASRRSERSRRAILDAALELIGETGFAKLTIEAIAARAGVGKQTIYRWWPSKAAVLFEACVLEGVDPAGVELPDTGDLAADLRTVLRATVDELNDPRLDAPTRALVSETANDPELGRALTEKVLEPQLQAYARRLRAAQEAGQVDPDADVRIALELLVGPLFHRWLNRTLPLTHAYADAVLDLALRGLAPRP